jgi:hypothetical protein
MPKDYDNRYEQWSVKRQREQAEEAKREAARIEERRLREYPKHHKLAKPSVTQLTTMLAERLVGRTRRPEDQYREAYRIFGCPRGGVTKERLAEKMASLGIVASPRQVDEMFARIDLNKNGRVEFRELCAMIMPTDFTRPLWNDVADRERRELEQAKYAEAAKESPFGFDKIPGWHGMKSFGDAPSDSASARSDPMSDITGFSISRRGSRAPPSTSRSRVRHGLTLSRGAHPRSGLRASATMPALRLDGMGKGSGRAR